jgi:hypothetical protein
MNCMYRMSANIATSSGIRSGKKIEPSMTRSKPSARSPRTNTRTNSSASSQFPQASSMPFVPAGFEPPRSNIPGRTSQEHYTGVRAVVPEGFEPPGEPSKQDPTVYKGVRDNLEELMTFVYGGNDKKASESLVNALNQLKAHAMKASHTDFMYGIGNLCGIKWLPPGNNDMDDYMNPYKEETNTDKNRRIHQFIAQLRYNTVDYMLYMK